MTRQEWIDEITDIGELVYWCRDNGEAEEIVEDLIDDDILEEYISDDIRNCDYGWMTLRDCLDGIDTGYYWYRVDGAFDYVGLDRDDFEDYKQQVLDELDSEGYFDPEEDEESEEDGAPVNETCAAEPVEYDELEIDEVDLDAFESVSTVIWGIAGDAVESFRVTEESPQPVAAAVREEQDTTVRAVDLDDIFALPF